MKLENVVVCDFETEAIEPRPKYPPRPVGVALLGARVFGGRPTYLAWGHPSNNNASKADAVRALKEVWKDPRPKLFHNAKFDLDVAETHLGLKWLDWRQAHDTLFLLFLTNPHRARLSLKEAAEEELGIAPTERDELRAWIIENVPEAKTRPKSWGAWISRAPGDLVGRYAKGDTTRPLALYRKLYPQVLDAGMGAAYDRERRLLRPLIENERRGIHVDVRRIERDAVKYGKAIEHADDLIRQRLGAPELDVGSSPQLADALDDAGAVESFILTAKGNRSTSKKNLEAVVKDQDLFRLLVYRGAMSTYRSTFMLPWLRVALETGGKIHTTWNQVRQDYHGEGDRGVGARTGRLSSTPNFQNIPKVYEESELGEKLAGFDFKKFGLPFVPSIRAYVIPEKGNVLLGRDYSQQELRILAHFEDGALLHAYHDDPQLDQHELARRLINEMLGTSFKRKPIKNTGFGLIYGMGVGKLARQIGEPVEVAKQVHDAYLAIFPGLKALIRGLKDRARTGRPLRTWGGRLYYVEGPKVIAGRLQTFEYKLLNYLIQGSAADCTKEAMIRYWEAPRFDGHDDLTAHDELLAEAPEGQQAKAMAALKAAMESVEFDLPMLTDGKISKRSWGEMKGLKDG